MAKYIFVVGGVISGTGKGISAASIGLLLSLRGNKVQPLKCDGYLNVNAGILAPREHGEVFLCDDGSETDLDLGHYARIIGVNVSSKNIVTSGTLYKELIEEQEEGKYLGETVQVIPHVTNKIQERFVELGKEADIVICEIGGVVGDLENAPYLEALRQFKQSNWDSVLTMIVAPILWMPTIKEYKTKPFQQSVKQLQSFGIQPDVLLLRTAQEPLPKCIISKVSNLTNVPLESIFEAPDVETIYQVPIEFYNRHIDDLIADKFHLKRNGVRIHKYRELVERYVNNCEMSVVNVAVVGKYENEECYLSLKEAIYHGAVANSVRANIHWVNAEDLENTKDMRGVWKHFENIHAVIVPGGFDKRGIEGKIKAIRYIREKKIPFLGICLGLQCAVIEFARNICNLNANSIEFDKDIEDPVITFVEGQQNISKKSGTMRLGSYDCELLKDSLAHELYKKKLIDERHRHRYEVNQDFEGILSDKGFQVSGRNPGSGLIEIMELNREMHPFFIGTQAHPEFNSRLTHPAPLFRGLIAAGLDLGKI